MTFNPLFERLVDQADGDIKGMISYAIYKRAKREWILSFQDANERSPTHDEMHAYTAVWTNQMVANANEAAESALAEFASEVIADAKPQIVQEALSGTRWRAIWLSLAANALYTIILIVIAILLKIAGIDLISVVSALGGKR